MGLSVLENIGSPPSGKAALGQEVARFLFEEALLLDQRRFDEWVECLGEVLRYRVTSAAMPLARRSSAKEVQAETLLIDDSKDHMMNRIRRLQTGSAWAEEPPSRCRRLIGNVIADPDGEGRVIAKSTFLLHRSYGERNNHTFVGGRRDILQPGGTLGWTLLVRDVRLDEHVLPMNHISVIF